MKEEDRLLFVLCNRQLSGCAGVFGRKAHTRKLQTWIYIKNYLEMQIIL